MLQVIVRVYDGMRWQEIETVDIVNKGGMADLCTYRVRRYPTEEVGEQTAKVFHNRKDGALALVRRALEKLEERAAQPQVPRR